MRILVACEFSAIVRDAFRRRGHDAWSVDLEATEGDQRWHIRGDVRDRLGDGWDLMVAHPPCRFLAVSGNRWNVHRRDEQDDALAFVRTLMDAPVPRIAVENPVSVISSRIRPPDQVVQPWMFGHGETKATCLWLKGLPLLTPTCVVDGRQARVWMTPERKSRTRDRSRTYVGIADAMAEQWGRARRMVSCP
jgi:hypothetical protein